MRDLLAVFLLAVTSPVGTMLAGLDFLREAWRDFKAQRGRHGVMPDPTIEVKAMIGMGLLMLGYCIMLVYFLPRPK